MSADAVSLTQKAYAALLKRRTQLQEEVFSAPPANWEEFKLRQGQWTENGRLMADFEALIKHDEDQP